MGRKTQKPTVLELPVAHADAVLGERHGQALAGGAKQYCGAGVPLTELAVCDCDTPVLVLQVIAAEPAARDDMPAPAQFHE